MSIKERAPARFEISPCKKQREGTGNGSDHLFRVTDTISGEHIWLTEQEVEAQFFGEPATWDFSAAHVYDPVGVCPSCHTSRKPPTPQQDLEDYVF